MINYEFNPLNTPSTSFGVLSGLQIKALLPTLKVDHLGLSFVKVLCMFSCGWPRVQEETGKIMIVQKQCFVIFPCCFRRNFRMRRNADLSPPSWA